MGQHATLNLTGNAQFALDALLGLGGFLQLVVGLLELAVDSLHTLGMLVAAITIDGKEDDDEQGNGATCPKHGLFLGQLLFLGLILCIGDGEFGVELVHLRTGF